MEPLQYEERGYLHEDFRLFHLADDNHGEFPYHYHAFHKVIMVLILFSFFSASLTRPYSITKF